MSRAFGEDLREHADEDEEERELKVGENDE